MNIRKPNGFLISTDFGPVDFSENDSLLAHN